MSSIEDIVALRTNASTRTCLRDRVRHRASARLPTYIVALGTDLVPIDIGVRHQVDIWMTYHPDARSIRRVSFFIDWLRTLFDPKRYPWFGDEFIHPRELAKSRHGRIRRTLLNLPIIRPPRRQAR